MSTHFQNETPCVMIYDEKKCKYNVFDALWYQKDGLDKLIYLNPGANSYKYDCNGYKYTIRKYDYIKDGLTKEYSNFYQIVREDNTSNSPAPQTN